MNKKLLLPIVLVLAVVVFAAYMFMKKGLPVMNKGEEAKVSEVATDPSFPEVMGKLIEGFPELPVYPGATLVASAKTNPDGVADLGYRAKWDTKDSVVQVMNWYETEMPKAGWEYTAPDDKTADGEQVARISKGDYTGYVAAEIEGDAIEIVVDLRKD